VFSDRVAFNLEKNRLTLLLEEKRRARVSILDLTESNPTTAGFAYPEQEILEALCRPEVIKYEPTARGLSSTRKAIAEYYFDRGIKVSSEQILLTSSTSEAYSFLFKLLMDPGDEILIPCPSYPLFEFLARLEGTQVQTYSLHYEDGWHYDLVSLASKITDRTKAIVLVNPNNPTGSYIGLEEWETLKELVANRSIALICDEVFVDYPLSDEFCPVDPASDTDLPLFILNGLSKTAGLPQFKLGWISLPGRSAEVKETLEHLEIIADTFLSVSTPIQLAGPDLLKFAQEVRRQIRDRIRENYHLLKARCSGTSVQCLTAQGGWYANLRLPNIQSEETWTLHLLEEADTLVHPGYFYGYPEGTYLIISLLPQPEEFQEGVSRLLNTVD
jgi:aspartate/methionine/tyrosine aminotransferase